MYNFGLYKLPVFKTTIAYILGILLADALPVAMGALQYFLSFLVLFLTISVVVLRGQKLISSICLLGLFMIFGALNYHMRGLNYEPHHFSHGQTEDKMMALRVSDITALAKGHRLLTEVKYAGSHIDSMRHVTGQLMLTVYPQDTTISTGDLIIAKSQYHTQRKNTNPHVFDYQAYLANRSIYHTSRLDTSAYTVIKQKSFNIQIVAGQIRDRCIAILSHHLDGNNLAVAAAMVLGERKLITDELYSAFTDTGTVHVLAVSGLHVGIVAGIVLLLLNRIRSQSTAVKIFKNTTLIVSIWGFALLTGLAPAVFRAALMLTLLLVGKALLKQLNTYNTLALAAIIMLIVNPNLLFQAGFQFSFLAILGILFFNPPLKRQFVIKSKVGIWLRNMICISLSAQLLVSPLAVYYFHKLPLYFWFTGIFAIPLAVGILWIGLGLIVVSAVAQPAGSVIATLGIGCSHLADFMGWILNWILSFFNTCIFAVQKLPFCSTEGLWLSRPSLILIYFALFLLACYIKFEKEKLLMWFMVLIMLQLCLHITENHLQRRKAYLIVYDIYDQSLIDVFKDGYYARISPGPINEKSANFATYNNLLYNRIIDEVPLDKMGIDTFNNIYKIKDKLALIYPSPMDINIKLNTPVDFAILSKDSYSNIDNLVENYDIKKIILDGTFSNKKRMKNKIKSQAKKHNIPVHDTSKDKAPIINL